jgi:prophage regulatory protein
MFQSVRRDFAGKSPELKGASEMMTKFLRRPAVEDATGLCRSTIYQMMSEGRFPKPVRLNARAVGLIEGEIKAWLEERVSQRSEG